MLGQIAETDLALGVALVQAQACRRASLSKVAHTRVTSQLAGEHASDSVGSSVANRPSQPVVARLQAKTRMLVPQ